MKRIINIALIIMTLTQVTAPAVKAESKADWAIPVRFIEDVNTRELEEGNAIPLEITQDIYINGKLLFKQGGAGYAEIAEFRRAGFLGRGGKLIIRSGIITDIKGQNHKISLSANSNGDYRISAISATLGTAGLAYEIAKLGFTSNETSGFLIALGAGIVPLAFLFRRGNEAKLSSGKIMFARLS